MILKAIRNSPATYERLGLAFFSGHAAVHREQWFRDVWSKDALGEGDIFIN
jgi:hypothetical protein